MANRLRQEQSPYLLQHGDNPVDWYPWCEEAFSRARQEDKPVFLSIGYSTCHWCHVMARESFADEEVAEALNRDFISIKVDREERPDVDAVYMAVCQAFTGSGGWPLTVLMTPEQKPFFAGTYLPKRGDARHLGLLELLERAAGLWRQDREGLLETGSRVAELLSREEVTQEAEPDRDLLHQAYDQFRVRYDPVWGGFGDAPKFPTPHHLLFLLWYAQAEHAPEALTMVEHTLDAMARGGIQDQIAGGFSRYSTDRKWLIPHFEKMLYDNALLLLTYLQAYQVTGSAQDEDTACRTADYILSELRGEEAGFFCGQDADSEGEEGKYYAFTPEEVWTVLGEADGSAFCQRYGVTSAGNFEGKSILNRIGQKEGPWQAGDPRLQRLAHYRRARTRLHLDDKVLLSWNAWTILALARARILDRRYLEAACGAHQLIRTRMTDEHNRLYLRYRAGEAAHKGQLEDYAVYTLALLELYRASFDAAYLEEAILRADQMVDLFEDRDRGGYFITPRDGEQLIVRPKETYDGAIPSGNSAAAMALQALADLTGEVRWREAARRQLRFLAGAAAEHPIQSSFGLLAVAKAVSPHRELVCASREGLPRELADYLQTKDGADLSVLVKTAENETQLARCAPFTGPYPVPEQGAVYYLCENGACQAPTRDFGQLPLGDRPRRNT